MADQIKYYFLVIVCLLIGSRFLYLMFAYPELTEAQRLIAFWPEYLVSVLIVIGLGKLVFR